MPNMKKNGLLELHKGSLAYIIWQGSVSNDSSRESVMIF